MSAKDGLPEVSMHINDGFSMHESGLPLFSGRNMSLMLLASSCQQLVAPRKHPQPSSAGSLIAKMHA